MILDLSTIPENFQRSRPYFPKCKPLDEVSETCNCQVKRVDNVINVMTSACGVYWVRF